jgi:hypothetical protein
MELVSNSKVWYVQGPVVLKNQTTGFVRMQQQLPNLLRTHYFIKPHILQESFEIEFFTLEKYSPTTSECLN